MIEFTETCDICGEQKKVKTYRCEIGKRIIDFMNLCKECVKIQEKEGKIEEDK